MTFQNSIVMTDIGSTNAGVCFGGNQQHSWWRWMGIASTTLAGTTAIGSLELGVNPNALTKPLDSNGITVQVKSSAQSTSDVHALPNVTNVYGWNYFSASGHQLVTRGIYFGSVESNTIVFDVGPSPELLSAIHKIFLRLHEVTTRQHRVVTNNWIRENSSWITKYPWLREARIHERAGREEQALKIVYAKIGGDLRAAEFAKCDDLLRDTCSDQLPSRSDFYRRGRDNASRAGH